MTSDNPPDVSEPAWPDEAARSGGEALAGLSAETILGQVETAIVVVDHDGRIRYANPFAAALFGVACGGELRGASFRALGFDEDELGKVDNLERQACRGRDWEGTLSLRRPDGSSLFVRMTAVPMRGPAGDFPGTVITARPAVPLGSEAVADRVGLLDRIGERLSGSLELDATLRRVAETLVPQFADHCFIDLRHSDGLVRRIQVNAWGWQPPPGTWAAIGTPISYPPGHFCSEAIRNNEVVLVEDLREEEYPAPTEQSMRASLDVGLISVVAAPLSARGQQLGVLSLALSNLTQRDVQHYAADDRDLVAAIASRVALAIDNALLFEEERATALAFQNSLLPGRPPEVDGLQVAYRYVPARPLETHGQGIQTQVGGDWYDIIQLSAGRTGIVIGDVQGRGARAAAIMGQLRSGLRAFAQEDKTPAEILHRLDDWVAKMADDGADALIVSCTYLIYDPWYRELTIANAGHLAPLIVTDGDVRQMSLVHQGVLLGVRSSVPGMPPYREESHILPAGSTLIFYTDGLVDRRHRADGPGHYEDAEVLDMLHDAVQSVAHGSVEQIAAAAETAVPGTIDDDMAIVVIRTAAEDLQRWEVRYPAEPINVGEARRIAFDAFVRFGMDEDQADLACLLVSEVVTNVVLHTAAAPVPRQEFAFDPAGLAPGLIDEWLDAPFAVDDSGPPPGPEFKLRVRRGRSSVWIEVFDSDLRLPRIRMAGESDEGGRGLYLVDQLASRWGSRPTEGGKAVWFEIPIRSGGAGR
ncbi:MAG: SpoIIE family protein phosphatase [Actinomycetota bacterium]|nr:SpoIIE family protein phosphatase [Actinomycetota bacterium]